MPVGIKHHLKAPLDQPGERQLGYFLHVKSRKMPSKVIVICSFMRNHLFFQRPILIKQRWGENSRFVCMSIRGFVYLYSLEQIQTNYSNTPVPQAQYVTKWSILYLTCWPATARRALITFLLGLRLFAWSFFFNLFTGQITHGCIVMHGNSCYWLKSVLYFVLVYFSETPSIVHFSSCKMWNPHTAVWVIVYLFLSCTCDAYGEYVCV